jgi:hypothetical protein
MGSAALLIRLSDPGHGNSFLAFFRAHDYQVDTLTPSLLDVCPLNILSRKGDRERVTRHIEAWQANNPGASAEVVDL